MAAVLSSGKPARLPTVLTRDETARLLGRISDAELALVIGLLYGAGLRLLEALRLRVKDVDLSRRQLTVRDGKGCKDRVTMIPDRLVDGLQARLIWRQALHRDDLAKGRGEVWLPHALATKYPQAPLAFGWQYVFPAATYSVDPRSGAERRHHLDERRVQRTVAAWSARSIGWRRGYALPDGG